jgi:hypothetical protein
MAHAKQIVRVTRGIVRTAARGHQEEAGLERADAIAERFDGTPATCEQARQGVGLLA